ncbi:hypothetical protein PsorP6_006981 [Peronosclerospora sorghi]|uniref:Uncharacterized protein n=1 Tax=Peronosclerospora sorghi TaxID=230839 RepID=A0ACC0WAR4_9STRA|nr:hypothetical protein PsorP6_006981 [Peronosclerospora sorghi]
MQHPVSCGAPVARAVTYRWTSGCNYTKRAQSQLHVTCAHEAYPDRPRRNSWTEGAASSDAGDRSRRPQTTRDVSSVSPTRVRFIYEDEDAKARVCGNVHQLLNAVQRDPEALTANAQVARKVLKYRRVMERLEDVNVEDPNFDASAFFGMEWCRVGATS